MDKKLYIFDLSKTRLWKVFLLGKAKVKKRDGGINIFMGHIYRPRGLSTLAKEFTAATHIVQRYSNELSTLVSGKAKM